MNTKNRLLWFLLLNEIFDNCIIVPMWHLHGCSQVTLVGLFPGETDTTVLKWDWYDGCQVTLGPMLPIDVVMIVPKWHWHDCSQADFDFLILFCFLVCSLARFLTSNFHLGKNCVMYQDYGTLPKNSLILQLFKNSLIFQKQPSL